MKLETGFEKDFGTKIKNLQWNICKSSCPQAASLPLKNCLDFNRDCDWTGSL